MVIVKNLMATSITIAKGIKVTQVVAASVVPPVKLASDVWRNWMRYRVSSGPR